MVICLQRGADLHMAELMPLPLTVSCFSKIQIAFTFLVPAHPGSPGQRAVKRVCVYPVISRWKSVTYQYSTAKKSVFNYTCMLTMWHCLHSIRSLPLLQQSTDISCLPSPQQQTCSCGFATVGQCRDRQTTERCTLYRFIAPAPRTNKCVSKQHL